MFFITVLLAALWYYSRGFNEPASSLTLALSPSAVQAPVAPAPTQPPALAQAAPAQPVPAAPAAPEPKKIAVASVPAPTTASADTLHPATVTSTPGSSLAASTPTAKKNGDILTQAAGAAPGALQAADGVKKLFGF